MVDQVFSYSETGFQETETSAYLPGYLKKTASLLKEVRWNSNSLMQKGYGKPLIALERDIDGIPKASQSPELLTKNRL